MGAEFSPFSWGFQWPKRRKTPTLNKMHFQSLVKFCFLNILLKIEAENEKKIENQCQSLKAISFRETLVLEFKKTFILGIFSCSSDQHHLNKPLFLSAGQTRQIHKQWVFYIPILQHWIWLLSVLGHCLKIPRAFSWGNCVYDPPQTKVLFFWDIS